MAENLGITIQFQGETLKFDKSISGMNKAINTLKQDVAMLNKELKIDPKNITVLAKKFKNLHVQEKLAKDVLADHLQHLKELNNKGISPFSAEWKATVKDIRSASDRVIAIKKQIDKCEVSINSCNEEVEEQILDWDTVGNKIEEAGEKIKGLGDKLAPVSKAAGSFLMGAIEQAKDFEDAFADVQKTVNATPQQFDQIRSDLRELATQLPTTATELSHIAGLAGQMNVPAENIAEFTRAMVDFANSTDITAEEAVTDIAQIYNVIGKGNDFSTLDNLLSTIVELGNNTATTESAIVEMFRNVSAASSRVGMTEQQMAALAATLASLGLDKGGASAISKIMTNIDKAVDNGGEKLAQWGEVAGMTAKSFKELWNKDAAAGLLAVVQGIAKSNEEGTSFNQTLEDLGIKEIRQVDTLSRLVNANQNYADNIEMANRAFEDGTALSEEAEKRYQTLASQLVILKNNFMEFALTIGDIMLPYVKWFVESLKELADWLNNLGPHTKVLISRILAITAVLAPLVKGFGIAVQLFGSSIRNVKNLALGVKFLWTTASTFTSWLFPALQAAGGFLAANIGWIALIMGVVVAVKTLYENCIPFREFVDGIIQKIKDLWEQFQKTNYIELLGEKFGWLGEIIGGLIELVKILFGWFSNLIDKILEFLGLKKEVESATGGLSASIGRAGNSVNVINSGGYGSGGDVILNASFNVSTNNVTRSDVRSWASWIADDVNEELGRRIR